MESADDLAHTVGFIHSNSVASSSFLSSLELNGPGFATPRFAARFDILKYCRYADNCLFVLSDASRVDEIMNSFASPVVAPYTFKLEERGSSGVDFLDVRVLRGPSFVTTSKLEYRPVQKAKGMVLSPLSQHTLLRPACSSRGSAFVVFGSILTASSASRQHGPLIQSLRAFRRAWCRLQCLVSFGVILGSLGVIRVSI